MPALADPTTWRTSPYKTKTFLYLSRPATLLAARVNMASPTFPLTSLDFDGTTSGSYTNVKAGHTLLLGSSAGASDKGIQRVRTAPSSTNIPVGRSSNGVFVGELAVADNLYITVLKERRLWAKIPRITASYELLKDEQSYSDALALAPVVIMGSDFAARVNASTGKLTVTFDGSASYAVASGATISTYLWNFDGGTGVTNTATTTAEFDPGEYDVSLTVTDSDGKVSTGYRWIVAVDRTPGNTYAAIPVEAGGRALRYDGQTVSVTVKTGSIPYGTYPRGTRAILFQEETYGATAGSLNDTARGSVKFTGWLGTEPAEIEARREGRIKQVTLDLYDIGARLRQVPQFPQVLHRKATATTWAHAKSEIANLDGAILYYLRHHTTALEIADFRRSSYQSLYTFSLLDGEQGSPFEQCDRLAMAMRGHLTINSRGQLAVKSYPNYLPNAAQATAYSLSVQRTTTTIVALDESDWQRVRYTDGQPPGIHWNNGSAIQVSTQDGEASTRTDTPLFAIAPGESPGQGVAAQDNGQQLGLSQAELNVIEGNRYAVNNAELSMLDVDLTRGGDAGIEPADMEWVTLTVSSDTAAQRGLTLTAQKMLPIEVNYDLSPMGVQKQRVSLERETSGETSVTVNPNQAILPPFIPPSEYIPDTRYDFSDAQLPPDADNIAAFNLDGYVYLFANFRGIPVVTRYAPTGVTGSFCDAVPDSFVPNAGWYATLDGIWRFTDVTDDSSYTQVHAFTGSHLPTLQSWVALETNRAVQNFVSCVYGQRYDSGDPGWVAVSTDDGSAWTAVTLPTFYSTQYAVGPDIFVSGRTAGRAWLAVATSTANTPEWGIYETLDYGATWNPSTEFTPLMYTYGVIHAAYSNESFMFTSAWNGDGFNNHILQNNTTIFGPGADTGYSRRGLRTDDNNSNVAVIITGEGIYASFNMLSATPTRTLLLAGTTYRHAATINGVYYCWGASGRMGYSSNLSSPPEDKRGNLPTDFPLADEFINIMGTSV